MTADNENEEYYADGDEDDDNDDDEDDSDDDEDDYDHDDEDDYDDDDAADEEVEEEEEEEEEKGDGACPRIQVQTLPTSRPKRSARQPSAPQELDPNLPSSSASWPSSCSSSNFCGCVLLFCLFATILPTIISRTISYDSHEPPP